MFHRTFQNLLFPSLFLPFILTHAYQRLHGDLCDWRSSAETCDQSRGLACSYKTQRCNCWDMRTIYSSEKGRCVGRSGEECHFFGGERLCTENSYCLEDESLSPIPICICLKGFFKGSNGSCIRKSKYGERCDLSSKYNPAGVGRNIGGHFGASLRSFSSTNSMCDSESGLQCVNYTCQCESDQMYDPERELCISMAGMPCSKSLQNCVENADCTEKIWAFDRVTGDTKMIGHRCSCKPGLKVTEEGLCAVEYGGYCSASSECYFGEGLTCINSKCQCHPLSQVYDKRARKCLNLVGTKCQAQQLKQDRLAPASNQQEVERSIIDFTSKPQQQSYFSYSSSTSIPSSYSPYYGFTTSLTSQAATSTTNSAAATTSSSGTTARTTATTLTTKNTSPFTTSLSTSSSSSGKTHGIPSTISAINSNPTSFVTTQLLSPTTTEIPNLLKSRNLTSRNFYFYNHNSGGSNNFSNERERHPKYMHFISPRHYNQNQHHQQHNHLHHPHPENLIPEHRSHPLVAVASSSSCVSNSECIQSSPETDFYCRCKNGSSETILRTCLLDHGESCGQTRVCNVFKGLVCQSDTGTCQCADPMLIYDVKTGACLSSIGNPCGKMKLNSMLLLDSIQSNKQTSRELNSNQNYQTSNNNKEMRDEETFPIPPFYPQHQLEQFIYINCVENSTCVDISVYGQLKQVCVLRGKFSSSKYGFGL